MYFIGAEEGSENDMEITSETSVANTNGALPAIKYATPPQGNVQSMYVHKIPYLIIICKYLVREDIPMEEKMKI